MPVIQTVFFPLARRTCENRKARISFGLACVRRVAYIGNARSRRTLELATAHAGTGYPAQVLDELRLTLRTSPISAWLQEWLFDPGALSRLVEAALAHALEGDAVAAAQGSIEVMRRHLELANVMPEEAVSLELAWQVKEANRLIEEIPDIHRNKSAST